jgi:hypothetical protein
MRTQTRLSNVKSCKTDQYWLRYWFSSVGLMLHQMWCCNNTNYDRMYIGRKVPCRKVRQNFQYKKPIVVLNRIFFAARTAPHPADTDDTDDTDNTDNTDNTNINNTNQTNSFFINFIPTATQ